MVEKELLATFMLHKTVMHHYKGFKNTLKQNYAMDTDNHLKGTEEVVEGLCPNKQIRDDKRHTASSHEARESKIAFAQTCS